MARKRKIRIPKAYISIDPTSHTTYLQHSETGKMRGRKYVAQVRQSDKTRIRRVSKGKWIGTIQGRTPAYPVHGSSRQRAHLRRRL
ncbi:hypothetical protein LCGC14_0784200 [marine sediment metagenome]|uniref:Uncharacterized protein n=1 Tax=marine sediment metagenome TaxID=412755 RepID=A0A0F9T1P0_9ZZZZ